MREILNFRYKKPSVCW